MTQEMYATTLEGFPDAVQVYLSDVVGENEAFRCGIITEGGLFQSGPAIAITSERIHVIRSGLVDTRGRVIPAKDVESFRFEQTDDVLVRFVIGLESNMLKFTLRDFPEQFADRLAESFGGVPVRIDLPEHRSERRVDPKEHAEQAVTTADEAQAAGDIESAITELETARDRYERVKDGDAADAILSIEERIELLRQLETIRSDLQVTLTEAERSFRTAVAAHANGKRTLARIRYRQARDGYAEAATVVENASEDVLVGGLDVPASFDGDPPPRQLSELRQFDDTPVVDFDRKEVDDIIALREASTSDLAEIHRNVPLHGELGVLVLLLSWWDGEETRRFEDRSSMVLRARLTAIGSSTCR